MVQLRNEGHDFLIAKCRQRQALHENDAFVRKALTPFTMVSSAASRRMTSAYLLIQSQKPLTSMTLVDRVLVVANAKLNQDGIHR